MEHLFIIAALTILSVQAQFENITDVMQQCIEESGVDPEEVKNKKICEINQNAAHLAEYLDCFAKGINLIDKDRNLITPNIFTFETKLQNVDPKVAQKAIDKCNSDDHSERKALDFVICCCRVEAMEDLMNKCIQESRVDRDIAEKNENCIVVEDTKFKKYLVCHAKPLQILSPKGEILKPGLRSWLEQVAKVRDPLKVEQIANECSVKKETAEETIFETRKCVCSKVTLP